MTNPFACRVVTGFTYLRKKGKPVNGLGRRRGKLHYIMEAAFRG
jgi:hypothetical protein